METGIVSEFGEKPKDKVAWLGMWFGLGALVIPSVLGILTSVARPLIDPASMEGREYTTGIEIGVGLVLLSLLLAFFALRTSLKAYKLGERSWVVWVGMVSSILIGSLWILMIIGEFVFPH